MNTHTLGAILFAICAMIVLVGLVSPKPALSEVTDGYGNPSASMPIDRPTGR